jgi:hypothetical protein
LHFKYLLGIIRSNEKQSIEYNDGSFKVLREIARFLDGVFVGQFLYQVQIPFDHPGGEIIRWAADYLRALPGYMSWSDFIEHQIWILVTMDVSKVTHHAEAVAKCSTIRLGVSNECFTCCNAGADMHECPSF